MWYIRASQRLAFASLLAVLVIAGCRATSGSAPPSGSTDSGAPAQHPKDRLAEPGAASRGKQGILFNREFARLAAPQDSASPAGLPPGRSADLATPASLTGTRGSAGGLRPHASSGARAPAPVAPVLSSSPPAAFVIFAAPQNAGVTSGAWVVAAAALDAYGRPISGLPVSFRAQHGSISPSAGTTDSLGAVTALYSPPSPGTTSSLLAGAGRSSRPVASTVAFADTLVATAADRTAAIVVSSTGLSVGGRAGHASAPAPSAAKARSASPQQASNTSTNVSVASLGVSGPPGSKNPFTSLTISQIQCLSPSDSAAMLSAYCAQVLSGAGAPQEDGLPSTGLSTQAPRGTAQGGILVEQPNLLSATCEVASDIETATGVLECVGVVAIPVACAAGAIATAGTAGYLCVMTLTGPEAFLVTSCVGFVTVIAARMTLGNRGDLAAQAGEFGVEASPTSGSALAVGFVCDIVVPAHSQAPACVPGVTCMAVAPGRTYFYVADALSNSVALYDDKGYQLPLPSGAFPNLSGPDGLTYDPKNGLLYVMNTNNDTITAYDLDGNEVVASGALSVPIQGVPGEDVAYDAVNDRLYVNDPYDNEILAFDASTGSALTLVSGFQGVNQPYGVFWNPADNNIYVSNDGPGTVSVYDGDGTPVQSAPSFSGIASPDDFALDPATGDLYVTEAATLLGFCFISGIAEYDVHGNNVTPANGFSTVDCPDDIAVYRERLYVTNIFGSNVTVYETGGKDVTVTAAPGGFPGLSAPTGIVALYVAQPACGTASAGSQTACGPTVSPGSSASTVVPDVANPALVITGSGFGTLPNGYTLPYTGNTPYLEVLNESENWHAGYQPVGSAIGDFCNVTIYNWTDTEIDLQANVNANQLGLASVCPLSVGDQILVNLYPPAGGVAAFGPIPVTGQATFLLTPQSGLYAAFDALQTAALMGAAASAVGGTTANTIVSAVPVNVISPQDVEVLTDIVDLPQALTEGINAFAQEGLAGVALFTVGQVEQDSITPPQLPLLVAGIADSLLSSVTQYIIGNDIIKAFQTGQVAQSCSGYSPVYIVGPGAGIQVVVSALANMPSAGGPRLPGDLPFDVVASGGVVGGVSGPPGCAADKLSSGDVSASVQIGSGTVQPVTVDAAPGTRSVGGRGWEGGRLVR